MSGEELAAVHLSRISPLARWAQFSCYGLSLAFLATLVIALMAHLAFGPQDLDSRAQHGAALQSGLEQLPWFIFPLTGLAVILISHWLFAAVWARLGATFFGSAVVLYILAIPEFWSNANKVAALCARRMDATTDKTLTCYDLNMGLMEVQALTLFIWSLNIVLPVVLATILFQGWLLLFGAVLRGLRARLRGQYAG